MKKKVFIVIAVSLVFVIITFFGGIERKKYNEKYKKEDDKIFGTYNKDYKKIVDENSRTIVLEADTSNTKIVSVAVANYISNVGGELVSINSFRTSTYISKSRYVILVPVDAKFADNLQERLDNYLRYSHWRNTRGGG